MKTPLRKIMFATLLAVALGLVSASAQVIVNGSFENNPPAFPNPPASPNGWVNSASIVPDGWNYITAGGLPAPYIIRSGSSTFSTAAQDGDIFIGLQNNTANSTAQYGTWIYQNITGLAVGENYTVSFYLRARNTASEAGTLHVQLGTGGLADNISILSVNAKTGPTVSSWELVTTSFTATAASQRLNFVFLSNSGDQMVFIDNVTLVPTSSIPEPSTYAALAGVVIFMSCACRRSRHRIHSAC